MALDLKLIVKTSYIKENKVIIGYKLNGSTLESAFERATVQIKNNMALTLKYTQELQRLVKNEKISQTQKDKLDEVSTRESAAETS